MRKIFLIFFLAASAVFNSSAQGKWKSIKPFNDRFGIQELWIEHWECTSCGDAEVIDTCWYNFSDSLKKIYSITQSSIFFANKETFSKIFRNYKSKRYTYTFIIRGRFTGVRPATKGTPATSIFDVYQYKLISRKNSLADE
jgi:hypothetical protein